VTASQGLSLTDADDSNSNPLLEAPANWTPGLEAGQRAAEYRSRAFQEPAAPSTGRSLIYASCAGRPMHSQLELANPDAAMPRSMSPCIDFLQALRAGER